MITIGVQLDNPYKVKVHEEYLIYDLMAMISAIGGTMGLCIAFSFMDLASLTISPIENIIDWCRKDNQRVENTVLFQRRAIDKSLHLTLSKIQRAIEKIESQAEKHARAISNVEGKLVDLQDQITEFEKL